MSDQPSSDQPPDRDGPPEDEPRPISVRDLMPEPSPERRERQAPPGRESAEPVEATREPSEPGTPIEDDTDDGEEDGESRPTPVRVAMDAPPPGDSRPMESLPTRPFEVGDQEWIVRITGRTVTGTRPDAGAHLMQLEFYRAEEPETPARKLLTVERPLEALYPEDLAEYLERARTAEPAEETI